MDNAELLLEIGKMLAPIKESQRKIEVTIENEIRPQLQLLYEGQQGMNDQLKKLDLLSNQMEDVKCDMDAMKEVITQQSSDAAILKMAR